MQWLSIGGEDDLIHDYEGPDYCYLPTSGYNHKINGVQLPYTALLPYYSDEYLEGYSDDYVAYQVNGIEGSQTVTFHWVAHGGLDGCGFYKFYVVFQESLPNEVTYYYETIQPCDDPRGLVGASSPYGKFAFCFCLRFIEHFH